MKRLLLPTVLFVALQVLSGCAFMGPDDREFFGRGWVSPKELDTPSGGGSHSTPPVTRSAPSTAGEPLPVTQDAWDVPGGTPQY